MAKLVRYLGAVQGVGFRATTVLIARRHPNVRGWVRNLSDGQVELLVDGPEQDTTAFLEEVRQRMASHIEAEEVDEQQVEKVDAFYIRR